VAGALGKWTAPSGSMDGTKRSMLPKLFLGTLPCASRVMVSVPSPHSHAPGKDEATHVLDRRWNINIRLVLAEERLLVDLASVHLHELFLAPAVDGDGALLDKLARDLVGADGAALAVPVFGRLDRQDVGAAEDAVLALEEAVVARGRAQRLVAVQVLLEDVAAEEKREHAGRAKSARGEPTWGGF